ncbi:MAG: hypothetical protein RJA70_2248 [Pseudomonadota bacterium]
MRRSGSSRIAVLVALFTLCPVSAALAQPAPAPVAPTPAPIEPAAPVTDAAPAETPSTEAAPVEAAPVEAAPVEAAPVEAAPVEAAPSAADALAKAAEEAPKKPSVNVGVWGRVDVTANNPADPKKLNDLGSTGVGEFHFSGSVHENVGWTANLVAGYGGQAGISGNAGIMDLIAEFGFHDSVNLWAGRMLVPSDRSNFSGPWFMSAWDYPGLYLAGPPIGPKQGPQGRNDGLTLWGNILDGHLKYYVGAYDLHDPTTAPLLSGRVNIALINPEPGYYSNSTYYGGKDVLALGIGFQSKKNGSSLGLDAMGNTIGEDDDYSLINADLLFEKNFGDDTGTLDLEGAFYAFGGDNELVDNHAFGLVSYLLPGKIGPGMIQPTFRFQLASPRNSDEKWTIMEGNVGYVINQFALRTTLAFVQTKIGGAGPGGDDVVSNALKLGVQFQQ